MAQRTNNAVFEYVLVTQYILSSNALQKTESGWLKGHNWLSWQMLDVIEFIFSDESSHENPFSTLIERNDIYQLPINHVTSDTLLSFSTTAMHFVRGRALFLLAVFTCICTSPSKLKFSRSLSRVFDQDVPAVGWSSSPHTLTNHFPRPPFF